MNDVLYLDNAATTEVHPEVVQTIMDTMKNIYGNPSSLHSIGREANEVLKQSAKVIAERINCRPSEIVFTSGACEANSMAILGFMADPNAVLVTTPIEHKSILSLCEDIKDRVHFVEVNETGLVNLAHLSQICKMYREQETPVLVSIQAANSEVGTIQELELIASICRTFDCFFHTDATQLFPYQRIDVHKLGIDMLSMSGQKCNAPKGVGFLYVRKGIQLKPLIYGSQMDGRRGGTENIPYIVGLARATQMLDYIDVQNMIQCRDYIMEQLLCRVEGVCINGDLRNRLPNNINISFKDVSGESLLMMLDLKGICVSAGSACDSKNSAPSFTLSALNVPKDYINGTIRITIPDDLDGDDCNYVIMTIMDIVGRLRHVFANAKDEVLQ